MTEANAYSLTQEGAQKLSTHFRVREFACKDGSDPLFISPQLVQLLEQVRFTAIRGNSSEIPRL